MNLATVEARIAALLAACDGQRGVALQAEVYTGALAVMTALYGPSSSQEKDLRTYVERIREKNHPGNDSVIGYSIAAVKGSLRSAQAEIAAGFVGSLQASLTGDVLTDLVKLSRSALSEPGDDAKNVAAVLAAASFEDAIRRLAELRKLPSTDKLADVLTSLKDAGIMQGAQVGIAQSYLAYRNKALHAKWPEVDRVATESVLAFVEQLLLVQFR